MPSPAPLDGPTEQVLLMLHCLLAGTATRSQTSSELPHLLERSLADRERGTCRRFPWKRGHWSWPGYPVSDLGSWRPVMAVVSNS